MLFLGAGFEKSKQAFVGQVCAHTLQLPASPARVARLEGEQAFGVQVRAHALQQRLLAGARQKCLESVASHKDQPELLAEVERARVALYPAYGQANRFAARLL